MPFRPSEKLPPRQPVTWDLEALAADESTGASLDALGQDLDSLGSELDNDDNPFSEESLSADSFTEETLED